MTDTPARGLAHLIGSVPLATTEEVFRTLAASLGDLLSRVPDGETGERRRWVCRESRSWARDEVTRD